MSEILGTLFKYLMALLAVAAVVYILYEVLGSNKVSSTVADITQISSGIQSLYAGQANYSSLNSSVAYGAKIFPNDLSPTSSGGTDVWGGTVTVNGSNSNPRWFDVTLTEVPVSACMKIAASVGGYEALNGQDSPLNPAQLQSACSGGTMKFSFGQ